VDQFNKRASGREPGQLCPILICSLKAGGTGLNLTGADRVIHLDRWWNPAVENQATDRAHRYGQTRTVFVNTLTNDGTLEDSMNRIFEEKRRLAQDLLADEDVAIAESLKDESGYLNLVDPKQLFYKN
jgi:SNF2 family DNA or RNA helicase